MNGTVTGSENNYSFAGTGHLFDSSFNAADFTAGTAGSQVNLLIARDDGVVFFDDVALDVIPEPATLGMVAFFGGGLLIIRRKLMM